MSRRLSPIQALLAELKRRRVFRVTLVYGATAFVVIETADLIFPRLALPEWTVTLVVALAFLGFPIALVLAWAFELTPEGVRRTEAAATGELEAIVAEPRRRRWPTGLLALAATVLLLAGVWFAGGREFLKGASMPAPLAPGTPGLSAMAVAVLPFTVQASPELAYLREGMVNLLSTKLDGAGQLRSVDPRALLRVVEREGLTAGDPEAGRRIAERFGADLYVVGDLVEVGGRIQLAAALHNRAGGGEPIGEGAVEGDVDGLFELVDELAARLLSGLSGGPAARVKRIAAVTTSSLPALKAFFEGEELFRRAQFGAAVDAFQRAVAEDSLFALAYYRLSITAEWNLQDQFASEAAEQAVRYDQRLSDRDRRLLEAYLVRRGGANAEAERHYRSILGTHPDEVEAWLDLGEILFHANPLRGRSFTDSREAMEKVLYYDPRHSTSLIHMARIAAYEGDFVELDSLAARFMLLNPQPERTREIEALRAFAKRDAPGIEATLAKLEPAEDLGVALAVWATAVYARNLEGATRVTELLTAPHRSPEARRLGYAWLAHLKLAVGKWADAQAHLAELADLSEGTALEYRALLSSIPFVPVSESELAELSRQLARLDPASIAVSENPRVIFTAHDKLHPVIRVYLLGLTRARSGGTGEAGRFAEELRDAELPPTAGSLTADLAHSVAAQILIAEGRTADALAELEQTSMETWYGQTLASPFYCHIFARFARAEMLYELGRLDEALAWYGALVEISPFEVPYLAISHLRRAEIYDELDDPEQAASHYARFAELWKDADPEFQPQVAVARRRLQELSAQQ